MQKTVKKLKKRNLLWFTSLFLICFGLYGIANGAWITYNGLVFENHKSDAILSLLDSLGMTVEDGIRALLAMGIIVTLLYLIEVGAGILGILSSRRYLRKRSLFWISIFLIIFFLLFGLIGLFSWSIVIINVALLLIFASSVFTKYNRDQYFLKKRKKKKRI